MKIDNVYVAFLKSDNEEHLLYKKSKDNYYYDLNSKEKHHVDNIDFSTLISIKDTIYDFKYTINTNMLKTNIKKIYNKDRKELIDTSSLVIVDLKRVSDYEIIDLGNKMKEYKWKSIHLYKTILKLYVSHSYEDLRNERFYLGELPNIFINGCIYVADGKDNNMKYLRYEYPHLASMEKKKVLELSYRLSKNQEI